VVASEEQAMSHENVETVRQLSDAYKRGDQEAWLGFYSPDTERHMETGRRGDPDSVSRGHDGLRRAVAAHDEAFEDTHWERELLIDAGDLVVGLWRHYSRHRADGMQVCIETARVYSVRDGKVTSTRSYPSWESALASVRVSNPPVAPADLPN
jgi:ketosteroid isomerase-like protein